MWTQYGIMQHNSSLYDVQFSGGLRYFCCALDVQCEQIGKSRIPPPGFIERVVFSPQQPKLDVATESKANLEKELADIEKSIKEVET